METLSPTQAFAKRYQGIEGFYMLSGQGGLGYIRPDDGKAVQEAFPQLNEPDFLAEHPKFAAEVERFRATLPRFLEAYLSHPELNIEMGHLEPALNPERSWRSATMMLYGHVQSVFHHDDQARYDHGEIDRFGVDGHDDTWNRTRGIHRGMEDLYNHRSSEGFHRFFPVLYYLKPSAAVADTTTLSLVDAETTTEPEFHLPRSQGGVRILNLFWNHTGDEPAPGTWALPFANVETESHLFQVLRENLYRRGAIDPAQRVERKFDFS